jgi:carbamoyltransferase
MQNTVLGLHKDPWHDAGAAAVATNDLGERAVACVAQERLDRIKNSRSFPEAAMLACLRELGLQGPCEVDLVVRDYIYNLDWRADIRRNACRTDVFLKDLDPRKLLAIRHHLCHAASCFYTSPFEQAAILVVDGRGTDWETQSLWTGCGNSIDLVEDSHCVSIGLIYEAVTHLLGFGFLEAGKTMGLAPFGRRRPGPVLEIPGTFKGLTTDYSRYCDGDSELLTVGPDVSDRAAWERCAFEIQEECERALAHLTAYAKAATGLRNLCLTGGVALNAVANQQILKSGLFEELFINPACSDSGVALGAALFGYHNILGAPRDRSELSPFTGPSYPVTRLREATQSWAGDRVSVDVEDAAVELLANDQVLALYEGRSEMGPRALGNRSVLMDPRHARNRDYLNDVIKRREPFRPFAPCVPIEHAASYFETQRSSPHMLFVVPVRSEWRERLAAVTHIDGTARLQTVERSFHPRLHDLLLRFGARTGVSVLLNTSFNVAGEPLVETPEDAVACFTKTGIDGLLIGDQLLLRR